MNSEFRLLLEAGDAVGLMKAHQRLMPHLPAPKTLEEAEITMHIARTVAESIPMKLRHYSHAWLRERHLPSQLPGKHLPKIVETVGISVNFRSQILAGAATEVRQAMESAVEDCYANGDKDPVVVTAQMELAKTKAMKSLFGRR